MRQIILPALLSLLLVSPALAQDASNVDIMDIYQKERHAHRQKIADAAQAYHDRWFEHVNKRYGVTLKGMSAEPAGQAMFEKYKTLEANFDTGLADLYSDDAIVGIFWTDENKKPTQMLLKGVAYKDLINQGMAQAAEKKDKIEYSDVTYEAISNGVLISGRKTSTLRGEATNFKMFLRPREDGKWKIEEEKLEAVPGTATTAEAGASVTDPAAAVPATATP